MTDTEQPPPGSVVVGVDLSTSGVAALRWAKKEADKRGAPLVLVTGYGAWDYPDVPGGSGSYPATSRSHAVRVQKAAVDQAFGDAGAPGALRLVHVGLPSRVLVAAAREADLLVVGARTHQGITALVLGSTASAVVRHAPCPVVIVPAEYAPAQPSAATA